MVAILADLVFAPNDPRVSLVAGTAALQLPEGKLKRSAKNAGLLTFDRLYSTRREGERIAAMAQYRSRDSGQLFESRWNYRLANPRLGTPPTSKTGQ
jgi:hypothetical protein